MEQPETLPREPETTRQWVSWLYFLAPFACFCLAARVGHRRPSLAFELIGFVLVAWQTFRERPAVTAAQAATAATLCVVGLGLVIVKLRNSFIVVPLVPAFLFLLLSLVVAARAILRRRNAQTS